MRLYFLTLFMVLLTSCGNAYIDSAFRPFFDLFNQEALQQEANVNTTTVSAYFGTMPVSKIKDTTILGYCNYNLHSIFFNYKRWENATEVRKEVLIFHELGHCLLGRLHRNSKFKDETPHSIMNEYLVSDSDYVLHRDYYISELFHPSQYSE